MLVVSYWKAYKEAWGDSQTDKQLKKWICTELKAMKTRDFSVRVRVKYGAEVCMYCLISIYVQGSVCMWSIRAHCLFFRQLSFQEEIFEFNLVRHLPEKQKLRIQFRIHRLQQLFYLITHQIKVYICVLYISAIHSNTYIFATNQREI